MGLEEDIGALCGKVRQIPELRAEIALPSSSHGRAKPFYRGLDGSLEQRNMIIFPALVGVLPIVYGLTKLGGNGAVGAMSSFMANAKTVQQKWIVIDATDLVVGRLAVTISNILRGKHKPDYTPHCDTGDFVIIVNAEKVHFTGKKWDQKEYQDYSHYAGGQKITPAKEMLAKKPGEIIRRAVKRMMPRGPLGFKQLGKLKIYAGNQHPHQAQNPQELKLKS